MLIISKDLCLVNHAEGYSLNLSCTADLIKVLKIFQGRTVVTQEVNSATQSLNERRSADILTIIISVCSMQCASDDVAVTGKQPSARFSHGFEVCFLLFLSANLREIPQQCTSTRTAR